MRARTLSLGMLILTACTHQYSKPGATDANLKVDMNTCIRELEQTKPPFELSGGMITPSEMDTCLANKALT